MCIAKYVYSYDGSVGKRAKHCVNKHIYKEYGEHRYEIVISYG